MAEIDISSWNGLFDWKKAKEMGVKIAILKASQRDFADPMFVKNMEAARGMGIQLGAYHFIDHSVKHYSAGKEAEFGKAQARKFMEVCLPYILEGLLKITLKDAEGNEFDATLWADLEQAYDWDKLNYANAMRAFEICGGFADKAEAIVLDQSKKKMTVGLYCSQFLLQYENPFKKRIPPWVAWYTEKYDPGYSFKKSDGTIYYATGKWYGKWLLHQYTSEGPGVQYGNQVGNVYIDLNRLNQMYSVAEGESGEASDVGKLWKDMTETEKIEALHGKHPEIL